MTFLFADSTTTGFQTNFLEDLRDAVDFAATIAAADERIVSADAAADRLRADAEATATRLEHLSKSVLAVLESERGDAGSPNDVLASELGAVVSARHQAVAARVTEKLGADLESLAAEKLASHRRYASALASYLLVRDPPAATTMRTLTLMERGKEEDSYDAKIEGQSEIGLAWSIDLAIPAKTMWSGALRVDRVVDGLEITAPQGTGLIKRQVKLKKQKLGRLIVTSFVDDGRSVKVAIRAAIDDESGFDFTADLRAGTVAAARTGGAKDEAVGPFDVQDDDRPVLLDWAAKLRAGAAAIPRKKVTAATFDGAPFDGTIDATQPGLVAIVERLVAQVAPNVREIAMRSHTPDELILRRMLEDGRREEIFLPKSVLRDKIAVLGEGHRALFAALELEALPVASIVPAARESEPDPILLVRSELPPSNPPFEASSASEPPPPLPSPAAPEPLPPAAPTFEPEPPSATPKSTRGDLGARLKEIRALSLEGKLDEAHRAFASFLQSASFRESRAEEQRLALKVLVLAKSPPTVTDAMREAFAAAVGPLQALIVAHHDPADYEMIGATYVVLGEPAKATGIFKKALEIERARDPGSDLVGSLMRRVSEI